MLQSLHHTMRAEQIALALCIGVMAMAGGCRQRAYTELYVDKMAGEIRELEDRVWEYDSAYQSMEQELIDLQRANDELQRRLDNTQSNTNLGKPESPLRLTPRDSKPKSDKGRSSESLLEIEDYGTPAVVVPSLGDKNKNASPKTEELSNPPMSIKPPGEGKGKTTEPESLPPPLRVTPVPEANGPVTTPNAGDENKDAIVPEVPRRSVLPAPALPSPSSTFPGATSPGVTLPGATLPGASLPGASLPGASSLNGGNPSGSGAAPTNTDSSSPAPIFPPTFPSAFPGPKDSGKNRIPVPGYGEVRQASAIIPVENAKQPLVVQDTRVNEIAFHPTLCRGHNFDSTPGDDGLYLVVVPLNSAGQPLNEVGKLTIVVEDDAASEAGARVAAWEVSETELRENLTPIGMSQGFHLSLPWQEREPAGNKVSVYIRYTLRDGRTMVNRRDLQLHRPSTAQSTWTPR